MNIREVPWAKDELRSRGITMVPATVTANGHVHGWNPAALAELVGFDYDPTPALAPPEILARIDGILDVADSFAQGASAAELAIEHPRRKRTLGHLLHHIARVSTAFADAVDEGFLRQEWLEEPLPEGMDGAGLAEYIRQSRERMKSHAASRDAASYAENQETYYGAQTRHQLLERTAWHAGQHLRQAHDLLSTVRTSGLPPLPEALFAGLPMPKKLW